MLRRGGRVKERKRYFYFLFFFFLSNAASLLRALRESVTVPRQRGSGEYLQYRAAVSWTQNKKKKHLNETTEWSRVLQVKKKKIADFFYVLFSFLKRYFTMFLTSKWNRFCGQTRLERFLRSKRFFCPRQTRWRTFFRPSANPPTRWFCVVFWKTKKNFT